MTDQQPGDSHEPREQPQARAARESREPREPRKQSSSLSGLQVMFAAILAISLILAINFTTRIAANQPLQELYEIVQIEIEELQQEQAALIAQRDYVMSDAYVEAWARSDGKMIRPNEVLVIPVPAGVPQPSQEVVNAQPVVPVETTPPEPEEWTVWWALFFDTPPPEFLGG